VLLDLVPQNDLAARLMHPLFKLKPAAFLRRIDGPARQHPRDFGDIFLGVPSIHSQGVKLHQFAAVVLIEAAVTLAFALGLVGMGRKASTASGCGFRRMPCAMSDSGPTLSQLSK